jgi:phosphatidate cytidylyltransferase
MQPLQNITGETAVLEAYKHMKTRIMTGVVLVPVLFLLALAVPKEIAMVVYALMMSVGSYELLYCTRLVQHPRLVIYACVMAFLVTVWSFYGASHPVAVLGILLFMMPLFGEMMLDHVKVRFEMIAMTVVAGLIVPYLLTAVIRILAMKIGRYMILMPFAVAFLNDAGAYFVGMKFGKHKLAPVVSPNKTIEGMLGGIGAAVLGMIIYAVVLHVLDFRVNYLLAVFYGLVGSVAGVFGDLCFSIIKRQTGIKDYGNIFPGHGGILDRLDSVMAVAPLMEALLLLLPFAVG